MNTNNELGIKDNTYDKKSVMDFLENKIVFLKEKRQTLEKNNDKLIKEAKEKREKFRIKAERSIEEFNEKLKLKNDKKVKETPNKQKKRLWGMFTKKVINPKTNTEKVWMEGSIVRAESTKVINEFIEFVCNRHDVEYQKKTVTIETLPTKQIFGFADNIDPVSYLEYWLDRMKCIKEDYIKEEEFTPATLFSWDKQTTKSEVRVVEKQEI